MKELRNYDDQQDSPRLDPFRMRWHQRVLGRVIYVLDAIRFWVTWPLRLIGRTLLHTSVDTVHRVEDSASWLRRRLTRFWWATVDRLPLERVQRRVSTLQQQASRSVDELAQTVHERTVHAGWIRRTSQRFRRGLGTIRLAWYDMLARAEQSPVARILTAPARWGTRAADILWDFILGWIWSRDFRQLLYGIPALILLMPLAYCGARMPFHTNEAKAKHYRRAVEAALADEDFDAANLYFRKLAQLGDLHDRVVMRSALAKAEQGNWADAYKELEPMAPLEGDELGSIDAHAWIADAIAQGKIETDHPNPRSLIRRHLTRILDQQPDNDSARIWLAGLHREDGELDQAREILARVRTTRLSWAVRSRLAEVYARLGDYERAVREAQPIAAHYQEQQQENAELTADEFLIWGAAAELLQRPDDATRIVLDGLKAHPDHEPLRKAATAMAFPRYENMRRRTREDWNERFELIKRMAEAGLEPKEVHARIAQLARNEYVGERARQLLDELNRAGELAPRAIRILGDLAVVHEEFEQAKKLYERALAADPKEHVALNNLAFLLAQTETSQLGRAIELATAAIELEPENPHYYETRGQIRVKQQAWQSAVDDLRRALNGMPHKREIHQSLAIAYQEIGEMEVARQHAVAAGK